MLVVAVVIERRHGRCKHDSFERREELFRYSEADDVFGLIESECRRLVRRSHGIVEMWNEDRRRDCSFMFWHQKWKKIAFLSFFII